MRERARQRAADGGDKARAEVGDEGEGRDGGDDSSGDDGGGEGEGDENGDERPDIGGEHAVCICAGHYIHTQEDDADAGSGAEEIAPVRSWDVDDDDDHVAKNADDGENTLF